MRNQHWNEMEAQLDIMLAVFVSGASYLKPSYGLWSLLTECMLIIVCVEVCLALGVELIACLICVVEHTMYCAPCVM